MKFELLVFDLFEHQTSTASQSTVVIYFEGII